MNRVFTNNAILSMLVFLTVSLAIAGCGYHIAGRSGKMPGDITSMSVPMFVNETDKPDIEGPLTSAFVEEFVTTVRVMEKSDAVMRGTIKYYHLTPVSYSKSDISQEYRLTVIIAVSLASVSDGTVIWEDDNIERYADFTVNTSDITATRQAETDAFTKISKDISRLTKERMIEKF